MLQLVTPDPDNTPDKPIAFVTLPEAAAALGCSIRTVRRRISAGELSATMVDGRRMVSLPETLEPASDNQVSADTVSAPVTDKPDSDTLPVSDTSPLVTGLQARIAELEGDRERARQDADRWQAMSQDLSQRLSEVTGTLYRLTEAKAITAGTEASEPPRSPWWAFWRH
jgi:excisionase family DNA binding protein